MAGFSIQSRIRMAPLLTDPTTGASVNAQRFLHETGPVQYHGGPLLTNVRVAPVFWNGYVEYQSQIESFYSAVVQPNEYFNTVLQYSVKSYPITYGTSQTPIFSSISDNTYDVSQVANLVESYLSSQLLPWPSADSTTYYPVHLSPNTTIVDSTASSCSDFCSLHFSYYSNVVKQSVYVGVIPDYGPSSACFGICGSGSPLATTFEQSSLALFNSITDAQSNGWQSATSKAIGDLCYGDVSIATLGDGKKYAVQRVSASHGL